MGCEPLSGGVFFTLFGVVPKRRMELPRVRGHCRQELLLGYVLYLPTRYYKELASAKIEPSPFIFGKVAAQSLSYSPKVSGYQRQIICKKYRHLIWEVTTLLLLLQVIGAQ